MSDNITLSDAEIVFERTKSNQREHNAVEHENNNNISRNYINNSNENYGELASLGDRKEINMRVNTALSDAWTFRGANSNQRGPNTCGENNTTLTDEIKLSGNRCGHNRNAFRQYNPSKKHKKRPCFIQKTLRLLDKLPLNQRSERREAILLVMQCIITWTDLITLNFCNGKSLLSLEFIAKETGIGLRRVKRAIKDLVSADYLTISERFKKLADGSHCGLIAIKRLTAKFFAAVGIEKKTLRTEQDRAVARRAMKTFFKVNPFKRTSKAKSMAEIFIPQILANLKSKV